jgi:hypothetical protein
MFDHTRSGALPDMEKSLGRRLLGDTATLVARGWCQGADARGPDEGAVDPWDERAVSWSLLGAIVGVLESGTPDSCEISLEELGAALNALAAIIEVDSLAVWNDDPERTQREVLATLAAAESRVESPWPDGAEVGHELMYPRPPGPLA